MRSRLAILSLALIAGCEDHKRTPSESETTQSSSAPSTTSTPAAESNNDSELAGMIRGKIYRPNLVLLDGNLMRFCKGSEFGPEQEIRFDLPVPEGERLGGREWKMGGQFNEPSLSLFSRVDGLPEAALIHGPQYELRIQFTAQTANSVEGVVDIKFKFLEKTFLKGPFKAVYRKSATAPLDESDAPFVHGKIQLKGNDKNWDIAVGFVGIGTDGKPHSNSAGFPLVVGQGASMTNSLHAPQVTSLTNHITAGLIYRHLKIPPGNYLVFVRNGEAMFDWQRVTLQEHSQSKIDLKIDLAAAGEVKFTLPKVNQPQVMTMTPTGVDIPDLGPDGHLFFAVARPKPDDTSATVSVPAGKYRATYGNAEAMVEVVAGKTIDVSLPSK